MKVLKNIISGKKAGVPEGGNYMREKIK